MHWPRWARYSYMDLAIGVAVFAIYLAWLRPYFMSRGEAIRLARWHATQFEHDLDLSRCRVLAESTAADAYFPSWCTHGVITGLARPPAGLFDRSWWVGFIEPKTGRELTIEVRNDRERGSIITRNVTVGFRPSVGSHPPEF